MKKLKKKVGRPEVDEKKTSFSVSVLPSKKARISKKHGSLSDFVNKKIEEDLGNGR